MNYTKFHRKELKSKFKFRIIIFIGSIVLLIASILAMQLTYFCDDSMKNILSIIAGLFVSLIAWSGVAVFEFAMELKSQYVEERSDFIKRLNDFAITEEIVKGIQVLINRFPSLLNVSCI